MDSNRVALYFGEEVTWGTAATCTYQALRFTGESFAFNITNITSSEIRTDRQVTDLIQTEAEVAGGFNFEFSYATFNSLLAGALWSTWSAALNISAKGIGIADTGTLTAGTGATDDTANFSLVTVGQWIKLAGSSNATNNGFYQVLTKANYTSITVTPAPDATVASGTDTITIKGSYIRNGVLRRSYTFVRAHGGLSSPQNQYFTFLGAVCNTFSLSVQSGAILTGSFDYMGKSATLASTATSISGATAAPTTSVFNAVVNVAELREGGADIASCLVQGVDFTLTNNVRGLKSIAHLGNCDIGVGKCDVTGTMTAYFKDSSLYQKYLDGTETSLSFKVADAAGNAYVFDFPQIEFESDAVNAGGQDQDVMESLGFRAYMDPTFKYTIQIARFPV